MRAYTLISLGFLSSLVLGCASTNQKSLLEERAGYGSVPSSMNLTGNGNVKYVPTRIQEKVIVPWLHDKELPSGDYFWGAWLSVRVAPEGWEMKAVKVPKGTKGKASRTTTKPRPQPPKDAPGKP